MKYLQEAKKFLEDWDGDMEKVGHITAAIPFALVAIAERLASGKSKKAKLAEIEKKIDLWLAYGLEMAERLTELERIVEVSAKNADQTVSIAGQLKTAERLTELESNPVNLVEKMIEETQNLPAWTAVVLTIKRTESMDHDLVFPVDFGDLEKLFH